jgi:hypothetical protein
MNIIVKASLLSSILTACSHDLHFMRMEDTLTSYGAALRWGRYETAADFQAPARRARLDMNWLKNIHVTSYDVFYRRELAPGKLVEQTAEIRYFNEQVGVEKIVVDRQTWRFDADKGAWILESDLPAFR